MGTPDGDASATAADTAWNVTGKRSMPTYEYICDQCFETETLRFEFYEEHAANCGACDTPMRKLYKPTPAHFKGSGWAGRSSE